MIAGNALRHQMILPEQQALFDYWRSKCRAGKLPSRDDISAAELGPYLPTLTLLAPERRGDATRYQFRLAGTQFWDIYNREITGDYLDNLPVGSRRPYWNRVLERVESRGKPSAGVVRSALAGRTHMAQFWVRLPLASDGEKVDMILGFDKFVRLSETALSPTQKVAIYA